MNTRNGIFISAALFSAHLFAFPCYFTLAKDNCWTDYNVTVAVTDANNEKQILTITVPKGKSWGRASFTCQPGQTLRYQATFTPTMWEGSENTVYKAQHFWALPETLTPTQKAWEISVCYPSAFAEVPLPPTAGNSCKCDFSAVPIIPPFIEPPAGA